MLRLIPFCLPIISTIFYVLLIINGYYFASMFIFFFVSSLSPFLGKFSFQEIKETYTFFHSSSIMKNFIVFNGIFFLVFQIFIFYHLFTHNLHIWSELLPLIYGTIMINSNFTTSLSHELMHHDTKVGRFIGNILLLSNGFFYLKYDHLHIHHKFLGTENDPASAKLGQSFYTYLTQSVMNRWKILMGFSHNFSYKLKPKVILNTKIKFLICLTIIFFSYFINLQIFIWLLTQFTLVTLMYEVITYIQHYGLRRTGKKVVLNHSWNCYHRFSAYAYFFMPLHSIHHASMEHAISEIQNPGPEFPKPFHKMFIIALFPKFWFRLMHSAIIKYNL